MSKSIWKDHIDTDFWKMQIIITSFTAQEIIFSNTTLLSMAVQAFCIGMLQKSSNTDHTMTTMVTGIAEGSLCSRIPDSLDKNLTNQELKKKFKIRLSNSES